MMADSMIDLSNEIAVTFKVIGGGDRKMSLRVHPRTTIAQLMEDMEDPSNWCGHKTECLFITGT